MSAKPFSPDELEQLAALKAMPDAEIDTSDIPEITDEQWAAARRGALYRPLKKPVTIRLDADVIEWFKVHADGAGYQTEINRVLRQHVVTQDRKRA